MSHCRGGMPHTRQPLRADRFSPGKRLFSELTEDSREVDRQHPSVTTDGVTAPPTQGSQRLAIPAHGIPEGSGVTSIQALTVCFPDFIHKLFPVHSKFLHFSLERMCYDIGTRSEEAGEPMPGKYLRISRRRIPVTGLRAMFS